MVLISVYESFSVLLDWVQINSQKWFKIICPMRNVHAKPSAWSMERFDASAPRCVAVINVDDRDGAGLAFLGRAGLEVMATQHEMVKRL